MLGSWANLGWDTRWRGCRWRRLAPCDFDQTPPIRYTVARKPGRKIFRLSVTIAAAVDRGKSFGLGFEIVVLRH